MHPAVAEILKSNYATRFRGLTPREAGVTTLLGWFDPLDTRWDSEAPVRAALIDTVQSISYDERYGRNRFPSAKEDLIGLLTEHRDDALRELDEIMRVYRSPYTESVVASFNARCALNELLRLRSSSRRTD